MEPQEARGTFQETALVQRETVLASQGQGGILPGQMAWWETGLERLGLGEEQQDLQRGVCLDHRGQRQAMRGQQGQLGVPQAKSEQQVHQEQQGLLQAMQGQLGQPGQPGSLRAMQGQLGQ